MKSQVNESPLAKAMTAQSGELTNEIYPLGMTLQNIGLDTQHCVFIFDYYAWCHKFSDH